MLAWVSVVVLARDERLRAAAAPALVALTE
jgi:hypothetical protein